MHSLLSWMLVNKSALCIEDEITQTVTQDKETQQVQEEKKKHKKDTHKEEKNIPAIPHIYIYTYVYIHIHLHKMKKILQYILFKSKTIENCTSWENN